MIHATFNLMTSNTSWRYSGSVAKHVLARAPVQCCHTGSVASSSRVVSFHDPQRSLAVSIQSITCASQGLCTKYYARRDASSRNTVRVQASEASDPYEHLARSKMMQSDLVQAEFVRLMNDMQAVSKIGHKFPDFDLEGKRMYLEQLEASIERLQIFMKRMDLAKDDANLQEFLRQWTAQMLNAGFTMRDYLARMSDAVADQRRWLEQEEHAMTDPIKYQQFKAKMRSVWYASPIGKMDMNDLYSRLDKMDPNVVKRAQTDPQFYVALAEIMENPANTSKWMEHPNIGPLALELWRIMQAQSWKQNQ